MATTVTPASPWHDLFGPTPTPGEVRILNAGRRNGIATVGDILEHCPAEVLHWRNVGAGSVAHLEATLADHGLSLAEHDGPCPMHTRSIPPGPAGPAPRLVPEWAAEAEWIGRQLGALTMDGRVYERNGLGGRWDGAGSEIRNKRRAWAFYRWGLDPAADWPRDKAGGFAYMAAPLPGSVELHLEGLNRLAHAELDAAEDER